MKNLRERTLSVEIPRASRKRNSRFGLIFDDPINSLERCRI
jgi:hypothetical protein